MGTLFYNISVVDTFMDETIVFGYADIKARLIDLGAGMKVNLENCNRLPHHLQWNQALT
jgi:hypothetical protein